MRYDSAIHTNEKDKEVPGPSRTRPLHIDLIIRSDSEPDAESLESNGSHATQITAEQNAGMRAESEKKHTLSDHTYHEQMVALGTSTPLLQQSQVTIVIGSDTETEDELPTFNGSQLVCIKREGNTTNDDTSVTDTPSRVVQETPPSPASECTSSFSTDFSRTPEISRSVSLSGFPKRNRKRKRKRNNPQLETALSTMPPEERDAYSQLYDEVGGSLAMSEDFSTYDCDVSPLFYFY
ncbi:unnamed protein product [Staurois parvus]|uniref:Uncharacterized protein n=1 Tax=Staurois parvus TaxID=386267 RepID=A0ABN9B5A4_9NEOB|nr:unnamed protein product [Staurois parvus]